MTEEEMESDTQRILDGEPTSTDSVNAVSDTPKEFKAFSKQFQAKNEERERDGRRPLQTPYFVKDNKGYYNQALGIETPKPTESPLTSEQPLKRRKDDLAKVGNTEAEEEYYAQAVFVESKKEVFAKNVFPSGGCVETPTIGEQSKQEKKKNYDLAIYLAKYYGYKFRLLPRDPNAGEGVPQPDAINMSNKNKTDFKIGAPTTDSGKNTIQNAIKESARQGCREVIISFSKKVTMQSIYQGVAAALQPGRARNIEHITILFDDGMIKRMSVPKVRAKLYGEK